MEETSKGISGQDTSSSRLTLTLTLSYRGLQLFFEENEFFVRVATNILVNSSSFLFRFKIVFQRFLAYLL